MDIRQTEVTAVVGPSGCGKTTLLRALAGLLPPSSGKAQLAGELHFAAAHRVSFAFQEPRLLPWKDALGNVEYVLGGLPKGERAARAAMMLRRAGLSGFESFRPGAMSGGMRQRLSLARAFAYEAELVLMDEAFQSIDVAGKRELMAAFSALWESERRTCVLVTHSVEEAACLGDSVVALTQRPARVKEVLENPVPRALRSPENPDTAAFMARIYSLLLKDRGAESQPGESHPRTRPSVP
jgi:NitT/TauT family transport system ATP-binding protein